MVTHGAGNCCERGPRVWSCRQCFEAAVGQGGGRGAADCDISRNCALSTVGSNPLCLQPCCWQSDPHMWSAQLLATCYRAAAMTPHNCIQGCPLSGCLRPAAHSGVSSDGDSGGVYAGTPFWHIAPQDSSAGGVCHDLEMVLAFERFLSDCPVHCL
jgi:hypothetical protein